MAPFDVSEFIEKFNTNYTSNKAYLYELFQDNILTFSEQKQIFDGLSVKQQCQLYNTISVEAREAYCESLKMIEAVDSNGKKTTAFKVFMKDIR